MISGLPRRTCISFDVDDELILNLLGLFEDTKGVVRIRISKRDRQHSGQKYKRTNIDLRNTHTKLKIE